MYEVTDKFKYYFLSIIRTYVRVGLICHVLLKM
jgi:hypothetical protein